MNVPRISIVVASRNDDHGGSMMRRMSAFLMSLDEQVSRHGLIAELVVVDWNPPDEAPLLHQVLPRPRKGSSLCVRYIVVPQEVHQRWLHWEHIPLYQMIAKNVGIRRSQGEFVLATNVDILFSDRVCEYLSSAQLDSGVMYRANRCDVPNDVLGIDSVQDQLLFCERNIIRRCGMLPPGYGRPWERLSSLKRRILRRSLRILGREWHEPIDTDACGDFTLLAKKAWMDLRGYLELGLYSIYIDSLGCVAAVCAGYDQKVLPPAMCVYHIDHGRGWTSMDVMEKIKETTLKPALDAALVREARIWMNQNHRALPMNSEQWGLGEDQLFEVKYEG